MAADDRERQFERALARHLSKSSGDSGCPDAETLAAYHERMLSLSEMARWKEHIAGCAKCQETLALVEQTEQAHAEEWEDNSIEVPVEEVAVPTMLSAAAAQRAQKESMPPARRKKAVALKMRARHLSGWAVPLGALAAGIIVWVAVHERGGLQGRRNDETVQLAKNDRTPQIDSRSAPEAQSQKKEQQPNANALDAETRAKIAPPPPQLPESPRAGVANEFDEKEDRQKDIGGLVAGNLKTAKPHVAARRKFDKASSSPTPAAVPQVGGVAGVPARDDKQLELKKKAPFGQQDQPASGGALGQPTPPPQITAQDVRVEPPKPSTPSQSVEAQQSDKLRQQTTTNEVEELSRKATEGKAGFLQTAAGDRRYILTPDERQVWQVGNSGEVLRTTNSGKTWKAQNSGVDADLTSGSAPSRDVCWLIGKAGTILLTTDGGKHWKQVAAPVQDDLGRIVASDARQATVWDASGQKSFKTVDGGETWTPVVP